jgi:hypothetical protein
MSTNFYFNNFNNSQEQLLIENLVIESIKIYGHDVYYVPRRIKNKDEIYGEDSVSEYTMAYEIDMYIRSYDSYEGDGAFLSKFNLEIRDQVTFTVAVRNFRDEVGNYESFERPREGDLIYLPMADRLFVIKYVNKAPIFYQMGSIQMYDVVTEMFEYSGEKMSTGIAAIDNIQRDYSLDLNVFAILSEEGYYILDEDGNEILQDQYNFDTQAGDSFADNDEIEAEADAIIDFSEIDPFSEGEV